MSINKRLNAEQLSLVPLLAIEQLGKQLGSTLVLAPHPYDAALRCGGIIAHLRRQNIPVWVIFITNGTASHPNSVEYPTKKLASLRKKEAVKSCKILDVESTHIVFLEHPDASLVNFNSDEKTDVALQIFNIVKDHNIFSVFLPWRREPHEGHKVAYELGRMVKDRYAQDIELIEYPIWLWKNSKKEDWPFEKEVEAFRLNIDEMVAKKRKAIFAHAHQTSKIIKDDPQGFTLTEDLSSTSLTSFELYFIDKDRKASSLEKEYFDTLYSHNPDPWNFRNSEYEQSKYKAIDVHIGDRYFENALELGCSIGIQTRYFAPHCKYLLAIDISESAIDTAKQLNDNLLNVDFQHLDVLKKFPAGPFNFVSMCEIGYYFTDKTLKMLFNKITENLAEKGHFLMVHWTSFVREYPLTGKKVHQLFIEFNEKVKRYSCVSLYVHKNYELMLWEKLPSAGSVVEFEK